jgi:hypothetical protein
LAIMTPRSTLAPVRRLFRAVVRAAVPAAEAFDASGWERAETLVDEALARRPPAVRRQVVLFLRLLSFLGRLRWGRRLDALAPARVRALMAALEWAPLLVLRRGVWGVRTLAFMGCYGQREVRAEVGYRADASGWAARGGDQGAWRGRSGAGAPEPRTLVRVEDAGGEALAEAPAEAAGETSPEASEASEATGAQGEGHA